MHNRPSGHVVVVGGGIAGLAAAHRLASADLAPHVTLLEAEDRLGGKLATERVDDFLIEAGPDSFLAAKPRGVGLSAEVGLEDRLLGVTPRGKRAFILHRGRLHELPEGLSGLVPTRLGPLARSTLLSPRGKARAALDYLLPARPGDDDESVGAFMRRRLGDETWELLVEPLMAGIYAADGDQLSLAATFPQLRAAERAHGGLIRGVLAARREAQTRSPAPKSPFLAPAGGMGELVATLETRLRSRGVAIRTNAAAERIAAAPGGYVIDLAGGEIIRADAVIVAAPAFAASRLLADLDRPLAADLAAIPYASTTIVSLAYGRDAIPHLLDGHGYVIPRVEGSPILACTWSSRKWIGRAPAGFELLRLFIGRAGDGHAALQDVDDRDLIALAQGEVAARLGVTSSPALTRVQRWPRGMPQYLLGHPERIARIAGAVATHTGLVLAGNSYTGVGVPDCIASGEKAAEAALAHLRGGADENGHSRRGPNVHGADVALSV